MSSTIAASFTGCLHVYEQLIILHTNTNAPLHGQIQLSALQDELGRFKVWAGNIAAHKPGRSSLDFRLRDATPLKERIIGLLSDIKELLQEACQISSGARPPRDQISPDTDSSSDVEEIGEGTNQLKRIDSGQAITELQQIFEDVITCIDCLYRLSMTIRNGVAAHDRLVKAGTIDTTFYEEWDIQHVKEKFPTTQEFLTHRLGKAISKRRQYFKYYEKHHKKLAQNLSPPPQSSSLPLVQPNVELVAEQPFQEEAAAESHVEITTLPRFEPVESIVATTVLTQTTASEFVGGSNDFEVESDSGQTSTSYATSASNGARLSLPPLPRDANDGRPFECPYCFTIVSIRNSHAWKRHIFRDLQPYVCTFDKCARGNKTYESRREWFDHELQIHRKEWFCTADCQKSFSAQSEFEDHMKTIHAISAPHQLAALAEMCQNPIDENGEGQCSLCLETLASTKQLCRHLARHLEDLALFALPHKDEQDEQDQLDSDRVQASEVSQDISNGSLSFSDNAKSESSSIVEDSSETIPDLLREFSDSETPMLPKTFFDTLANRLAKINSGEEDFLKQEDAKTTQLFTDVSRVLIEQKLVSMVDSKQQTGDLLLNIYVHTRKCYQKRQSADRVFVWEGLVDRVRALFINFISDCLRKYSSDEDFVPGLLASLAKLEGRLLSRSGTELILRAGEDSGATELTSSTKWGSYWKISQHDYDIHPLVEIDRQVAIHDLWLSEQVYIDGLYTGMQYYQKQLTSVSLGSFNVVDSERTSRFVQDIFNVVGEMRELHEVLVFGLENRIKTQGPWVKEVADIVQDWIPPAAIQYTRYAEMLPVFEHETTTNVGFKECFPSESSLFDWLTFVQSPATRLEQYSQILASIEECTPETSGTYGQREEKRNMRQVMLHLKSFTEQFHKSKQGASAKVRLHVLKDAFISRPGRDKVDLRLGDQERRLLSRGRVELLKTSTSEISFTTEAFLFDNYFVLTKSLRNEKYEVIRPPIPMSLLMLQDMEVDVTSNPSIAIRDPNRPLTTVRASDLYPIRIKHLGKVEVYTLFAKTEQERIDWCKNIVNAKAMHATALQEQQSEPFSLKILGEFEVAREEFSSRNPYTRIQGSPLFQAIEESNAIRVSIKPTKKINCGTCFRIYSSPVLAIGTEESLFVVKTNRAALEIGWQTARLPNVKQVHGLEKSDTILVLASDQIFTYKKKWFFAPPNVPRGSVEVSPSTDMDRSPDALANTVFSDFFTTGIMKGSLLLFCVSCEVNSKSNVEIFELLGPDAAEKRNSRGLLSSIASSSRSLSPSERFQQYDRMTLTKNCLGLTLFSTSITIITGKGFEITTLDKKLPQPVPDVQAHVAIKNRLAEQHRALGLFRVPSALSGVISQDFICVYDSCAVYIDKHGNIQRTYIMEFEGRAISATVHGRYLVLFHTDFIEIRNIHTGDLRQIIAGENIRCLDDSQCGADTRNILAVMKHPTLDAHELVFEMILNEPEEKVPEAQAEFAVDAPDSRLSRISSLARSNAQYDEYTASKRAKVPTRMDTTGSSAMESIVSSSRDDASDSSASWDEVPTFTLKSKRTKSRWSSAAPPKESQDYKAQKNKNCRMS